MGGTAMSREQMVVRAFVRLADTLVDDYAVIDMLDGLVGHSVELLAVESAGLLLADNRRRFQVVATSNGQTEWIELTQLQADEACPCACVVRPLGR